MPFNRFVLNTTGKKHRREVLDGRPHLVVEMAMLPRDGVVPGSLGPIWYPEEENTKSIKAWNSCPLVVYHPTMNGSPISARQPHVHNSRTVGLVFNTGMGEVTMNAEGWFDEEKTKATDERVYDAIIANRPMEISTGLELDLDVRQAGKHENGMEYIGKASNYVPDHLAVLPDQIGAFSTAMGGGMFAGNRQMIANQLTKWTKEATDKLTPDDYGDPVNKRFPVNSQEDLEAACLSLHESEDMGLVKRRLTWLAARNKLKLPDAWTVTNALSFCETEGLVRKQLAATYGEKGERWDGWVSEMYPDRVIYYSEGKLWSVGYSVKDGTAALTGTPVEVVRTTDYQPVRNQQGGTESNVMAFDRKKHIDSLIANGQYTDAQRADLENTPNGVLEKISITAPVTNNNPAPPPVVLKPSDAVKVWKASQPPEVVAVFNRMEKQNNVRKQQLVSVITANANNGFKPEFLMEKDLDELEGLVALLGGAQEVANNSMFLPGYHPGMPPANPMVDYSGMGYGYGMLPGMGAVNAMPFRGGPKPGEVEDPIPDQDAVAKK